MKTRTTILNGCIGALLVGTTLGADTGDSWYNGAYLSLSGGGHTRGRAAESANTWTEWDPGAMASVAAGYRFGRYLRGEVEGAMFHNNAKTLSAGPGLVGPAEGEAFMRAVMFNVYFDYPIKNTRFTPYVGGGVGFYKSYLRDLSNPIVQPFGFVFSGPSDGETFAYQIRAGLSYALTDRIDLWGGYRFFDGDELTFSFSDVPIGSGATFTAKPKEAKIHGAELGIRWNF